MTTATVSTSANDLVVGALRKIGALAAGETPNANDSSDALQVLNDMIESWSTDKLFVFAGVENILTWTPGQYQYTVGNPVGGNFSGTLVGGNPVVSNVTIPANLIVGGTVTDFNAQVPANTTITAIGTNTVTLSANALSTVSTPETFTYTVPGNFAIPRPLRIPRAFTRITSSGTTGLDYEIDVDYTGDKYAAIGLKGIPGPWPILLWYNPTFPLGNLYCYPNPQLGGALHLWTDTLFTDFTNPAQLINLPPGYALAIKLSLALLLAPEYGKAGGLKMTLLQQQAREAVERIKKLNSTPAVQAFFDRDIVRTRRTDAGWIFHGGFT
jgi:hypothetical protein